MKTWIHDIGSRGQEVRRIQASLGVLHPDGRFGPKTEEAVKQFQLDNSLSVDGRVGPETRAALGISIYAGIDISRWNKIEDWQELKSSGLANFCWIKLTEGADYLCPISSKHFAAARSNGVTCGAYHFARPDLNLDPQGEVKNFVENVEIKAGDLRPVLDFETAGSHDPDSIRNWVKTFLEEFESQSGVRPVVYTGGNMVKYYLGGDTTGIDDYTLWHAWYNKKGFKKGIKPDRLGGWDEWRVWQWTGTGSVPGASGNIDRNWLVGGPDAFKEVLVG